MAGLIALSNKRCYWPDCSVPIVVAVSGRYIFNVERAHIRAANPNGPRYDPNMPEEGRDAFSNLILLCKPHHTTIDKIDPDKYPVKRLERWKFERESTNVAELRGLTNVTEDRLQELISDAMEVHDKQIKDSLDQLHAINSEAADVLRSLVSELESSRRNDPIIDPDSVSLLDDASRNLQNLGDDAGLLLDSARDLSHLQDSATSLSSAADKIMRSEGIIASLDEAVSNLREVSYLADELKRAAARLEDLR
ncbi:hypothetical protein [Haloactinomyces albus]|uniref:ElaB/YqjD/DUF883 family membrane-anchored ribosome-binding protein n=1 Tax=Haloactinomyces albus TaxID=1352928 RepID=A0AAE3ZBF2_9ACTN|nr:hypothetical protein [Haloactinomyces albus]MDR7301821.1 ElaB/YqjD/DUF883 family membrane-anchored ribosome-binding protein [Haloactinomyces albus]MDR7304726.1 ElaB/YqjD/DUF883 family membrane-anchored ribosome-binding protein [Haloactinomyces albus]